MSDFSNQGMFSEFAQHKGVENAILTKMSGPSEKKRYKYAPDASNLEPKNSRSLSLSKFTLLLLLLHPGGL